MILPVRRIRWSPGDGLTSLLDREWLLTNGRGGYASGSIAGVPTRRFHGLLIAALPAPIGRAMMLSELGESVLVQMPDRSTIRAWLGGYERQGHELELDITHILREMRLEGGIPVWRFEIGGAGASGRFAQLKERFVIEKRISIVHMQNTAIVEYELLEGPLNIPIALDLRPFVSFRPHEGQVGGPIEADYRVERNGDDHEIHGPDPFPPLRLRVTAGERNRRPLRLSRDTQAEHDVVYRIERDRGYDWLGSTWSPGHFVVDLGLGGDVTLIASTEPWDDIHALPPNEARKAETLRRQYLVQVQQETTLDLAAMRTLQASELILAADAFIIRPHSRRGDAVKATASGDELRSIIAGYHWFTDWGRDTMIALEGLTLATGRPLEARYILRTFSRYVQDGLIPNMFPEGETGGLYHTADATLWFFHALDRYVALTGDRLTLRTLLPILRGIIEKHMQGTRFGIHVDPKDGLLSQGEEGYQLTWMDAKVDDWVVTPRRGKAVEINALFYNALTLLATWLREEDEHSNGAALAKPIEDAAARVHESFNRRFWYEEGNYLFDVIDEHDPALRPNQIFAVSLPHPVLDPSRWRRVVDVVEAELVTPVGLRSLARSHPDYKPRYDGDLRSRDAAYHQGTVWSWLIGPFLDAWLRVYPDKVNEAHRFVEGFGPHLDEGSIGSISEIFDAEPPFAPRGCVAQAWGVAEVLRCLVKLDKLRG